MDGGEERKGGRIREDGEEGKGGRIREDGEEVKGGRFREDGEEGKGGSFREDGDGKKQQGKSPKAEMKREVEDMGFTRQGDGKKQQGKSPKAEMKRENGVLGGYGARGACLHELLVRSPPCRGTSGGSDGFGLLRGYLTSIGANKGFNGRKFFSDFNWVLVNPKFHRLFSSEAPKKKNYENFYPKKKTDVPKGNDNQKSESKGISG
ncbi:hypothetical protein H6P81_010696 [Aristolochia fimbriata]|uniref:Uncharacterized protein n=1 Tax=Aristolochia fimbriata TaxID=158543 RepID=A0AAV7ESA5_ARIFI|nr:hypothetical protein H6P81_010696 [Aristolochia fimbriata]